MNIHIHTNICSVCVYLKYPQKLRASFNLTHCNFLNTQVTYLQRIRAQYTKQLKFYQAQSIVFCDNSDRIWKSIL